MDKVCLEKQIDSQIKSFSRFMGISEFPAYDLQTKEASIETADLQGFEVVASASYQPKTNRHSLLVSTNLDLPRYVFYHEFTHMLDSELYAKSDSIRYAGLSGFTEYHASQIELMQLLGTISVSDALSFSMNDTIATISGKKRVVEYVEEKRQHAIELFGREDFPADLNTLKSAFGVLFNYLGLRSICEMYSSDYIEKTDNAAFLRFIPTTNFVAINTLMHGWLDNSKIDMGINVYLNTLFPLIKEFRLA